MTKWPWIERRFHFDFPAEKWPDLLERTRGTPARIEERVSRIAPSVQKRRSDAGGWSILENVGHLIDLGYLAPQRVRQILAGEKTLVAADMSNKATNEADRNSEDFDGLLERFRKDRAELVSLYESLDETAWGKSALHPRLNEPMRIVDIAYFDAEHDDYHLGRIGELIRLFS